MPEVYPGLVTLNGNLMAAVDLETTGTDPSYHEIVQIAVVPIDANFEPIKNVRPFYTLVKPKYPEREAPVATQKHQISMTELLLEAPEADKVADLIVEWFESLQLPFKKRLVPLAHNWVFEAGFLKAWLGLKMFDEIFDFHTRDSMILAISLNDRAAFRGEPEPFNRVALEALCAKFKIINETAHNALSDSLATAKVYKQLLLMDQF